MFGSRFINKIASGNKNIQVAGSVGTIISGITFEEHASALERKAQEIREQQAELRTLSEAALRLEAKHAAEQIQRQQNQIDSINEILKDPERYIEYSENAQIKLSNIILSLEKERVSSELESVKKSIERGLFSEAELLIEKIENNAHLSTSLESEVVSARAVLAFLDLQFEKAELLLRRAFYLAPSVSSLVSLLDQMDMNGNRVQRLSAFREAKLSLGPTLSPKLFVRLLVIEAWLSAEIGEVASAKILIEEAESKIRNRNIEDNISEIELSICTASIYIVERDESSALKYFKIALRLLKENGEEDSLYAVRIEANIGACLAELGRVSQAISITERCVSKLRSMGGSGKYHLAIRLNNLGDFLVRNDQAREALPIIEESIRMAEEFLPPRHPSLIRRRLNLALAHENLGNTTAAISTLRAISVDTSMLGELDKRSFAKAHLELFNLCVKTKRWADALAALICIQEIGAIYLEDKRLSAALPTAISSMRYMIISSSVKSITSDSIPKVLRR